MKTPDDVTLGPAPSAPALSDANALAALILRSATDFAIVTSTPDGIISSWSAGAHNVMGWTAAEAVGRPVSIFFTPEDVAADQMAREMEIARYGGAASDERWHLKKDGTRFWASGEMQPLEENGHVVGFLKILRDRTAQHELASRVAAAEEQAAAANALLIGEGERLRELFEAAPGFIAVFRGPTHIFEITNASYRRLIAHRDVIGKPIREGIPEVEGQGYFELFDEVYRTGNPVTGHDQSVMLEPAPGAALVERIVDFVFQPIRDAGGKVTGIFLEGFDTTEAAATRVEVARASALQTAVLSQLGEGVIATDAEGRITFVNEAATRLHGVAPLDVAPEDYSDTYHLLTEAGDPYPPAELPLARAVLRGETVSEARWRIRRPDGSEVLAIGNAQPVIAEGAQIGAVLTVRDDTARRAAESKLAASEAASRDVLEGMDEGFITIDRDLRVRQINAEGLRIDGRPRAEIVGRSLLEVWPETEHLPNLDLFRKVLRTGKPGSIEYRHLSDVHDVWLETRAYPIEDGIAIFYRDISDRRRAADAVRASEARYQAITDSIDQMIWSTLPDGFHDYYNQRWYDFTGVPQGSTDGEAWAGMFHPDDQERTWAVWRHSLATGEPYNIEYRLRHRTGEYRWVVGRALPIRDQKGAITRWYGTCTDVHDVKVAEQALRTSEARYRTLFEAIDSGFCIVEILYDANNAPVDYLFVEVNPAFERQTGLVGARGKSIRSIVPDIEQHWIDLYAGVARTRQPARRENNSPALGRWFEVNAFPVDSPEANRVAILFNDVSDRKRSELALTELNRTLETRVAATVAERDMIWRTSQDLFVVTGLDGVHRSVNPAWTDALGYEPAELVGKLAGAFIHPDDVDLARAELSRLAQGRVVNGLDLRMLRKDGGTRWFSWTCVPAEDVFYASGRDVTHRKELEEQLRQSQKMEAVGQLTGGIAHDFNNLLTIVSGNIDMARRSLGADGDARALRSLGNAAKGADRAAALTQRLLAFSRRQPLQPRATDVNRLVTGMTELLDRALGETVDLQVVAGAGLWRVEVDPNQLENAILNLAVNARDAMPAGGKLTVETSNSAIDEAYVAAHREVVPGQYVMICVTDTGEGMPADVVAKAFDPFFSTKDVGKGTGLGLSQVYGYVKQSGGHVKIYSEAGEGTTVKLYLPRLIADMNAADEEEAVPEAPTQGQESILVVEDDDDVRIFTVDSLRELGYRVLEAHDGASALRLLERQEEPPRLLLTDVVMPGMSGRELAAEAGRLYPEMRVLYTTGYARNAIVHGGRLDPGVELLPKPFTFEALAAKIRQVIEKDAAERALVIDPADDTRGASAALLGDLGFAAEPAGTIREALGKLRAAGGRFDVVILNDAVPVGNLDAVISELHAVRSDLPILIVGATSAKACARYGATPCVGGLFGDYDAISLRDALRELRVRCAAG